MTKPPKKAAPKKIAPEKIATARPKPATPPDRTAKEPADKKGTEKKRAVRKVLGRQVKALAPSPADLSGANAGVLDRLFEVVTSRRNADPNISHSARLLSRGTAKVAQKFGEEAVECLIEAVSGNSARLVGESADVLYHLIVMWVDAGVHPDEVWTELQRREGTSGIAEKASRPVAHRPGE